VVEVVVEVDVRPGCPHCRALMQVLEELQGELGFRLVYRVLDYGVTSGEVRRMGGWYRPDRRPRFRELADSPSVPEDLREVVRRLVVTPYIVVRVRGGGLRFSTHIIPSGPPDELAEKLGEFIRLFTE